MINKNKTTKTVVKNKKNRRRNKTKKAQRNNSITTKLASSNVRSFTEVKRPNRNSLSTLHICKKEMMFALKNGSQAYDSPSLKGVSQSSDSVVSNEFTFYISPLNTFFQWSSLFARIYSYYRLKKCKFTYIHSAPNTVQGSVTMCISYDPLETRPDRASALNRDGTVTGALYLDHTISVVPQKTEPDLKSHKIDSGALNPCAQLFVYVNSDNGDGATAGELWVDYDFEVINPRLISETAKHTARVDYSYLMASSGGTRTKYSDGNPNIASINDLFSTNAYYSFTFPKIGVYFVSGFIATGTNSTVFSGSSYSNLSVRGWCNTATASNSGTYINGTALTYSRWFDLLVTTTQPNASMTFTTNSGNTANGISVCIEDWSNVYNPIYELDQWSIWGVAFTYPNVVDTSLRVIMPLDKFLTHAKKFDLKLSNYFIQEEDGNLEKVDDYLKKEEAEMLSNGTNSVD